jgi:hypothetical protein
VVNLRVGLLLVREVNAKPLSHAGDSAAKATLAVVQCQCRVMLGIALPSHAGDDAAELAWPRRDVSAESF